MMKALDIHNFSIGPLLFQLAARLELPALRRALKPTFRAAAKASETSLRSGDIGLAVDERNEFPGREPEKPRETQPTSTRHADEPRKTLFQLKAPSARAVKLVADFT